MSKLILVRPDGSVELVYEQTDALFKAADEGEFTLINYGGMNPVTYKDGDWWGMTTYHPPVEPEEEEELPTSDIYKSRATGALYSLIDGKVKVMRNSDTKWTNTPNLIVTPISWHIIQNHSNYVKVT